MSWIEPLMDEYFQFLREKTQITHLPSNEWVQISTPFLDAFNDTIDIYVKKSNGTLLLSDDGQTLRNLELNGVSISRSPKRRQMLDRILLNYGVTLRGKELTTEGNEKSFPQKKLNLLSAIHEANDLFVLARPTVGSLFREDVGNFLDEQDLIYTPFFISRGATGLEFTFDFQIAHRRVEVLIKAFNSVNKYNLPHFLFAWEDVRGVRERQTRKSVVGLAFINDSEREVKGEFLEALQHRQAEYILWSQRFAPENIQKLKAA